jgi:hypothetical protein
LIQPIQIHDDDVSSFKLFSQETTTLRISRSWIVQWRKQPQDVGLGAGGSGRFALFFFTPASVLPFLWTFCLIVPFLCMSLANIVISLR